MATPIQPRLTGEIWDLNIDELLAPMTEMPRLGGSGPFVINLSTASTPIEATSKPLAGIEKVHVYQIQRIEDRRPRYRLRIGPFAREDDADAALLKAREIFPGALTATAGEDDLQAIAALQARTNTAVANPAAPLGKPTPPPPEISMPTSVAPTRQNLESTQTLRPLHLAADDPSQWFVIQLSIAEQAFDPEALPNLDIFSVYRLYSVAGLDQGRVVHALRLGFFGAEIAARAVMSYVSAYYDKASITRVSVAERERFSAQRLEARKDVGATGRHAVIEITDERVVRARRAATPTDSRPAPIISASP